METIKGGERDGREERKSEREGGREGDHSLLTCLSHLHRGGHDSTLPGPERVKYYKKGGVSTNL